MHIQSLGIRNFRCFEEAEFTFHPQFNVILGANGSGKTTLLEALREILRIFNQAYKFNGYTTHTNSWDGQTYLSSNDHTIRFVTSDGNLRLDQKKPIAFQVYVDSSYWFYYTENSNESIGIDSLKSGSLNTLPNYCKHIFAQTNKYPVFAYYNTKRLCNDPSINEKTSDTPNLTRFSGYDNALSGSFSIGNLRQWFEYEDRIEYQERQESPSYRTLRKAMAQMLEGTTDITYNARFREIFIHQEDGRIVSFAQLSDGQRSLLTLAGDLAMRIIRLNPFDDALETTPGVVLIDELDLHLHPRWQRQVVHSLQRVFPKVQFIVTTHSPTIISEVPPECIILLGADGKPQQVRQAYGLDNNTIMESIMGAKSRPSKVQEAIGAIEDKIDDGLYQEARHLLDKLEIEIKGTDAELVGLRTSLETLESLAEIEEEENA
jgi:predicted ATP-binding protein involved in virulence